MVVVIKNKLTFSAGQLDNVTNIAYDAATKIYTITHGNNQTSTYSSDDWLIAILFK